MLWLWNFTRGVLWKVWERWWNRYSSTFMMSRVMGMSIFRI